MRISHIKEQGVSRSGTPCSIKMAEFEEELDFKAIEVAGSIYLLPNSGNGVLGFTTKDITGIGGNGCQVM